MFATLLHRRPLLLAVDLRKSECALRRPLLISKVLFESRNRMLDRRNMRKRFLHNESRNLGLKISWVAVNNSYRWIVKKQFRGESTRRGQMSASKPHIFQLFQRTTAFCSVSPCCHWTDFVFFCLFAHFHAGWRFSFGGSRANLPAIKLIKKDKW